MVSATQLIRGREMDKIESTERLRTRQFPVPTDISFREETFSFRLQFLVHLHLLSSLQLCTQFVRFFYFKCPRIALCIIEKTRIWILAQISDHIVTKQIGLLGRHKRYIENNTCWPQLQMHSFFFFSGNNYIYIYIYFLRNPGNNSCIKNYETEYESQSKMENGIQPTSIKPESLERAAHRARKWACWFKRLGTQWIDPDACPLSSKHRALIKSSVFPARQLRRVRHILAEKFGVRFKTRSMGSFLLPYVS